MSSKLHEPAALRTGKEPPPRYPLDRKHVLVLDVKYEIRVSQIHEVPYSQTGKEIGLWMP
jgi:hypothetical protein